MKSCTCCPRRETHRTAWHEAWRSAVGRLDDQASDWTCHLHSQTASALQRGTCVKARQSRPFQTASKPVAEKPENALQPLHPATAPEPVVPHLQTAWRRGTVDATQCKCKCVLLWKEEFCFCAHAAAIEISDCGNLTIPGPTEKSSLFYDCETTRNFATPAPDFLKYAESVVMRPF
jgi:hypothetical protein